MCLEPPRGGGAPPAPLVCPRFYLPGSVCARAFARNPGALWARAVLMLGIRPDCLRSEPRL